MAHATKRRKKPSHVQGQSARATQRPAVSANTERARPKHGPEADAGNSVRTETPKREKLNWRQIDGWFSEDDAAVYRAIVANLPASYGVVVEIGSWLGRSTGALIEACENAGKFPHIIVVDTFKGSPSEPEHWYKAQQYGGNVMGAFMDNIAALQSKLNELGRIHVIARPSIEAANRIVGRIDAAFIDAEHTFLSLTSDIKAWLPKIRPGGIIAGHDYDWDGVYSAVMASFKEPVHTIARCWMVRL